MNELLVGPRNGYYIATYACPTGTGREEYVPYYKLFLAQPESYFDDRGCIFKGRPNLITNDVTRALDLALIHAEEHLCRLPNGTLQQSRMTSTVRRETEQEARFAPLAVLPAPQGARQTAAHN